MSGLFLTTFGGEDRVRRTTRRKETQQGENGGLGVRAGDPSIRDSREVKPLRAAGCSTVDVAAAEQL